MVALDMPCYVGDYLGYIYQAEKNGDKIWLLLEDKVTSIRIGKGGISLYSRRFPALDAEDVASNTRIMEKVDGLMLTREVFVLNDNTRAKAERWIEWVNTNPDNVKGIWEE